MTLDTMTEPYLYNNDAADPAQTRTVHGRINMDASTATLHAIAGRDPVAEPPTLAELQALGMDTLAVQLAAVVGP